MEQSFTNWRSSEKKGEESNDSDESDYVQNSTSTPENSKYSQRAVIDDSDESDYIERSTSTPNNSKSIRSAIVIEDSDESEDVEYQKFNKISSIQSSTRIDIDGEKSYMGCRPKKGMEGIIELQDTDSDEDVIESSITIPDKSYNKLIKSFPIDDLDNEDDNDSFKIVTKKKNCRRIESDSETEDAHVIEKSASNYRKKESVGESRGETYFSCEISVDNNSTSRISCSPISSLNAEKETEVESSPSPKLEVNLQKSIEKIKISETHFKTLKQGSIDVNESVNNFKDDNVIIINSDLDESLNLSVGKSFDKLQISSPVKQNNSDGLLVNEALTSATLKTDIGDRIRVQQLLAEQKRLEIQIGKCNEELAKTKTTLRTANLSVLPDKGMKLQIALARQEANLRDLLIQGKNVKDQLEKVPYTLLMGVKTNQELSHQIPKPRQIEYPQWSNLPSAAVNIHEMGKRALETHRTQQALTVDALTRLHNSLKTCPTEDAQAIEPAGLSVSLMPHQKHALTWLLWRERETPSGGILADDMGLGKTLTMISLVLKAEEEKVGSSIANNSAEEEESNATNWLSTTSRKSKIHRGKTLVICPATLIGQWEGEVHNKVQHNLLSVEMYHGPNREKKESRLCSRDMVITTYNIVARECTGTKNKKGDTTVSKGLLFNIRWERIILDEAHQIRNHKSQTSLSVCELRAKHRWALTGTPIHNKELDLYALLKFIRCSPFDDLAVWKRWVDNRDAAGNQRLSTMVKALMLRRTKEDLQSKGALSTLLSKQFSTVEFHLDKEEFELYQKLLDFSKTLLAQFIEQKAEKEEYYGPMPVANKATRYKYDMVEDAFADHPDLAKLHRRMKNMADVKSTDILVLLLRLRQTCCHPCLIKAMLNKEEVMNVGIEDNEGLDLGLLEKMGDMTLVDDDGNEDGSEKMSPLNSNNPIFTPDRLSSKIKAILKTLEEHVLETKDKAIIVSQWTSMLELVYKVLDLKKISCVLLTGSVPVKKRADIVNDFNQKKQGPKIMLLSLTAGGVGLNLVGANHLLMIDLHWNPQLEAQACDRIYRVGQEKQVHIYKFVCIETIEERIQKLQEKKLAVAHNVLTGSNIAQASKLSLDDLKMLFNMK